MNLTELRALLATTEARLHEIHTGAEDRDLNPDEQTEWDEKVTLRDDTKAKIARAESRNAVAGSLDRSEGTEHGDGARDAGPNFNRNSDPIDVLEDRSATPSQIVDAVTRSVEATEAVEPEHMDELRKMLKRHGRDDRWSRNLLARSTPAYASAFEKFITANGGPVAWTPEEARAVVVGTNTSGGFLVPTVIDPTLIYTNTGSDNIIRMISRKVTLTGDSNAVNVISTAGVTASWDPELTEVSDDSPEIARPNIPIHKAAAFIVASIEATQDMGALFGGAAEQLRALFQDAKDRLEGAAFATGSGTNQPTGIFTALDANTNVELTTTTAATVGEVDIHAVYRSLGSRWRRRSEWLANPLWTLAIKRLGTSVSSAYSGDLREAPTGTVLGRPFHEAEDAPAVQTTTALDNILILGDWSNYVIADKPGSMAVEYIPHVFGATNGRPIGARGWYAYWRTGADSVNDLAFRLLQDKTSA
jgi:HK97 family phage major capsid protein